MPDGGPSVSSAAGRPRPTIRWRILHSWWLLLSIVGMGCLNGLGFLYVGLRARRPEWWIAGVVYLVLGWACFLFGTAGSPEKEPNGWLISGLMAVWVASLAHALMINSSWLRWRADYVPWHAQQPATAPGRPSAPDGQPNVSGLPAGLAPPIQHYYGPGPAAVPPISAKPVPSVAPGLVSPSGPGAGAQPAGPLDVNTAGPEHFAALPGFDPERVRRVLAERHARRGFGSVEEFGAVAELAPHEFVRVRDLLVCIPPGTTGRRPSDSGPWAQGRILDV
ncbi:helix-hairpin-helix domain-containing protein [Micromonospora sp. WMMD1102]|uniref:helix-hairpin-helix domain-containing protein n=1 Tax=Micromonospora sp. WMMD1102 TaxID=3016105 RepID=UPI002415679F|nr:helix-hairpin-helix domain-containing protein [Micromonospora sp. WMMD1102]MDG4785620.1 helix-hairpin-helix domain-containing protein [Micromonospora sp. WMMD1102]